MTDTVIHSIRVSYDQTDDRVRKLVSYLKGDDKKNEMMAYYNNAKEIHPDKKYITLFGDDFSLTCDSSHKCILKLRGT